MRSASQMIAWKQNCKEKADKLEPAILFGNYKSLY